MVTDDVLPPGVEIAGAIDVERGDGYLRPWRLPVADLELHHPALRPLASGPSGVRLRFRTPATGLVLDVEPVDYTGWLHEDWLKQLDYDLRIDGEPHATVSVSVDSPAVAFPDLPGGDKDVELWLTQVPGMRLRGLRATDGAPITAPRPDTRPRWTVHGSSITHGRETTPSTTWPAVAAHALGRNVTNLGYSGQCHLDPMVARMIGARPADHITLKLGINVHNAQSMRERAFTAAVFGFVATIRDAQPDTPVTVVSPIHSPTRETSADTIVNQRAEAVEATGDLALRDMREILADAVRTLRHRGDTALRYLDGRELFGPADVGHLPDGLHPNPTGLRLMGERYAALEAGLWRE